MGDSWGWKKGFQEAGQVNGGINEGGNWGRGRKVGRVSAGIIRRKRRVRRVWKREGRRVSGIREKEANGKEDLDLLEPRGPDQAGIWGPSPSSKREGFRWVQVGVS